MTSPLIIPLSSPEAIDTNRFGPKAANLAKLGHAGLPIPGGVGVDAAAYRMQLAALDLGTAARGVFAAEGPQARRHALAIKLALMERPIVPQVLESLRAAWHAVMDEPGARGVVRSSALVEDRLGSSFAGQFETFLGLETEDDFCTAVRACWAALWSTRALRYMATHDVDPADTAMALLIQPLVHAQASGGGLSRTAEGGMLLSAAAGLGDAIAQGEVVPDQYVLSRVGSLSSTRAGRKYRQVGCTHGRRAPRRSLFAAPALEEHRIIELGALLRRTEEVMAMPVEIEWALDQAGFKLLQARPLHVGPPAVPDAIWLQHPRINGHPSGIGWGTGRARVIGCECELSRVAPGEILITTVAGPALTHILPHVAGVVAELGGSTSHLASLARERGIPMVLGAPEATQRIPEGALVAVDGVAGIVRWMHG